MIFTDICLITKNVLGLAKFYEDIFNVSCELDCIHSYVKGPGLNIAIYDQGAAENDGMDFTNEGRGFAYIGFNVDDVDVEYERIKSLHAEILSEPKLWPWGAKSFTLKDLDGNRIVLRSWPEQS